MTRTGWLLALCAAAASFSAFAAQAAPLPAPPKTVCTITVNSADEKDAFRRFLPEPKTRFVELVERGRSDWLTSACRAGVSCDVLIISGHYDGYNEFFSEQLEVREFLPVDELERVACNDSCPGLFARLKEVYLFGCNTLNPQPQSSASAEIVRSLVREGYSRTEAQRQWQSLNAEHDESSRDRMRQVFRNVPVIYGFSSKAPVGPIAAASLARYLRTTGAREVGRGIRSRRLLAQFAPYGMSQASGVTDQDPLADGRRDMCQFADDRLSASRKLGFVHGLLKRESAEARLHLDRIQRLVAGLDDMTRRTPDVARALEGIARDADARARFLAIARDADRPAVRVRMVDLAHSLGWLSADDRWQELALMLGELQDRRDVGLAEIDLACNLNQKHDLDGAFNRRVAAGSVDDDVPHAAVRACLGSNEARARMLAALVSTDDAQVQFAQAYLRHQPITDAAELRQVAAAIMGMAPSDAQVRALEALGRHYVSDREILDMLVRLFAQTPSWSVQSAIAGILLRADRRSLNDPALVHTLREHRLPAPDAENLIEALIHKLQPP